jgi:hypothetical protein
LPRRIGAGPRRSIVESLTPQYSAASAIDRPRFGMLGGSDMGSPSEVAHLVKPAPHRRIIWAGRVKAGKDVADRPQRMLVVFVMRRQHRGFGRPPISRQ